MKYKAYMCRTDFACECGNHIDGNRFFADIDDLKKFYKCTDECGIVEVEISLVRVVEEGTD